ncbi:hypothetical protein [Chryseobacterium sp. Leaf201]|uniref:hypothetical protein n=1 Tax=Chryseobacterium sp. Leaf201 TaxID=1735672 RepID=UPI000FF878D4|nr:hypothetical protein [Chryseobacterium sp. Leaf201]
MLLWVNGTKVPQDFLFSNTRESCVCYCPVLAGFGRVPSPFLRYFFDTPSVPVRKKDVFSEQIPKKHRIKPGGASPYWCTVPRRLPAYPSGKLHPMHIRRFRIAEAAND